MPRRVNKSRMFLYSAVSNLSDHSCRALYTSSPADIFIPTPTRLLWEEFCHVATIARRLSIHIFPPLPADRAYTRLYTAEWTEASWRERKCPNFETAANAIWPRASPAFYRWAYRYWIRRIAGVYRVERRGMKDIREDFELRISCIFS